MKLNFKYIIAALAVLSVVGCATTSDADDNERNKVIQQRLEAQRQVGLPSITNFTEAKAMKRIYELRDKADYLTYTYIVDMNGKLHFLTRSIGYGMPYSTQMTNPQRVESYYYSLTLPQPEPNMLFMPESARWYLDYVGR